MNPKFLIAINLSKQELEILIGTIASASPSDKEHEQILVDLYNLFCSKYEHINRTSE